MKKNSINTIRPFPGCPAPETKYANPLSLYATEQPDALEAILRAVLVLCLALSLLLGGLEISAGHKYVQPQRAAAAACAAPAGNIPAATPVVATASIS